MNSRLVVFTPFSFSRSPVAYHFVLLESTWLSMPFPFYFPAAVYKHAVAVFVSTKYPIVCLLSTIFPYFYFPSNCFSCNTDFHPFIHEFSHTHRSLFGRNFRSTLLILLVSRILVREFRVIC